MERLPGQWQLAIKSHAPPPSRPSVSSSAKRSVCPVIRKFSRFLCGAAQVLALLARPLVNATLGACASARRMRRRLWERAFMRRFSGLPCRRIHNRHCRNARVVHCSCMQPRRAWGLRLDCNWTDSFSQLASPCDRRRKREFETRGERRGSTCLPSSGEDRWPLRRGAREDFPRAEERLSGRGCSDTAE